MWPIAAIAVVFATWWLALAATTARADTKLYPAAQVELDIPGGWKVETKDDTTFLSDPGNDAVVIVRILAVSQLEKTVKEADTAIKTVIDHVRWGSHPVSHSVHGMKAIALAGSGARQGTRVDVGAVFVTTPSNQVMLVLDFLDHAKARTLQPQIDGLVNAIRPNRQPAAAPERPAAAPERPAAPGTGFTVRYDTPRSPGLAALVDVARSYQFERIASALNQLVRLPRAVPIAFSECGAFNAYYAPAAHTVTVCYELIYGYLQDFQAIVLTKSELRNKVESAVRFSLLHELGHALIGELDIPVLGKEEDAADNFAAIVLVPDGDGEKPDGHALEGVLATIQWFNYKGRGRVQDRDFAWSDEHSFDLQRMYGIACILYGANPRASAALVGELVDMTPERLERCAREYPSKRKAWFEQLRAHRR